MQPNVKEDDYARKKASPAPKAYTGRTKRQEDPKERYRNPRALGTPVEPVKDGEKPTRQLGSQPVVKPAPKGFKDEKEVQYEPRRVSRYPDPEADIDGEELKFNFKEGKPVKQPAKWDADELDNPHGLLPDEFHN